ncbi:class F sortase [Amycolatopsis sp. YIM 10]|uniref:class F sortase n=1 Tax=Amycolatopsis sp. YIM 10 TaxID=2653857 RepID=UPI00128FD3E0|nr:class F sortase [Amycolatopsis sp. YIM 10]QFU85411.1 Sortase family protein [Amycolatopsis sp. YIM 10]
MEARWKVAGACGSALVVVIAVGVILFALPTPEQHPAPFSAAASVAETPLPVSSSSTLAAAPAPPSVPEVSTERLDVKVLPPGKPATLEIPELNVHTGQIMDLGLQSDGELQVPNDARTAGWYTESPTPGEVGPSVIAGHVDYNHVPGVFARLAELRVGSRVTVHRGDGISAVFTVYRVERHPKSAFPSEDVYGDTAQPELRLITCGGAFDRDSRQYSDNVVAYGRFTEAFRLKPTTAFR